MYIIPLWGNIMKKQSSPPKQRTVELSWKIFHPKVMPCKKTKLKSGYSKHKKGSVCG